MVLDELLFEEASPDVADLRRGRRFEWYVKGVSPGAYVTLGKCEAGCATDVGIAIGNGLGAKFHVPVLFGDRWPTGLICP